MNQLTCALTGTTLHNRQEIIRALKIGEGLTLHREPENPYDPNVIRVESAHGIVGYLPQEIAQTLSPQMDANGLTQLDAAATQLQMEGELLVVGITTDLPEGFSLPQEPAPAPQEPPMVDAVPAEETPAQRTPEPLPPPKTSITVPPPPRSSKMDESEKTMRTVALVLFAVIILFILGLVALSRNNSGDGLFALDDDPISTNTPRNTALPRDTNTPWPTITKTPAQTTAEGLSLQDKIATETAQARVSQLTEFAKTAGISSSDSSSNTSACRSWETVTLADVGKEFCVQGVVVKAWFDYDQNAFFMSFGGDPGDLYMVVYNGWYYENVENYCVQFDGEVMKLGNSPVFVVNPQPGNLQYCH